MPNDVQKINLFTFCQFNIPFTFDGNNHAYHNGLDTLTWDQEKGLELCIFGPSSKGPVQRACTVKCKRVVKMAERE